MCAGSGSRFHRERRQKASARAAAISEHPDCQSGGIFATLAGFIMYAADGARLLSVVRSVPPGILRRAHAVEAPPVVHRLRVGELGGAGGYRRPLHLRTVWECGPDA